MNPFKWIKEYFNLTRMESNGAAVAVVIIIGVLMLQQFIPQFYAPDDKVSQHFADSILKLNSMISLNELNKDSFRNYHELEEENDLQSKVKFFPFDPNVVTESEMQSLGLNTKLIRTIINYRSKGGKFFKASDMRKIYGLHADTYEKLEPYIRIKSNFEKTYSDPIVTKPSHHKSTKTDINTADSAELVTIRGIGPVFAKRIIKFRQSLGGFYSVNQLSEVYGMDSVRFNELLNQITLTNAIVKLSINHATFSELNAHPYINKKQANSIVNFRIQHGNYSTLADLKKLYVFTDSEISRLAPYLLFSAE